jgi:hypothetical protein
MNIRLPKNWFFILLLSGCNDGLVDDPIPFVSFAEEIINLSLPQYSSSLGFDGGTYAINGKGVRGIIVYRLNASTYRAYERNCSFQPNDVCATIDVHPSRLFFFDACCNSNFDLTDGNPTAGPAFRPLRQYRTQLNGTILTITDEIIN